MQPLEKLARGLEIGDTAGVIGRRGAWCLLILWLGCKRESPSVLDEFPPPRPAQVKHATGKPITLALQSGTLQLELKVGRAPLSVTIPLRAGSLRLQPENLMASQARIRFDLAEAAFLPDTAQQGLWEEALATAVQGRPGSSAGSFTLSSIPQASANRLALKKSTAQGNPPPTTGMRLTATWLGDLELHSVRAELELDVVIDVADDPSALMTATVKSRRPTRLSLRRHALVASRVRASAPTSGDSTEQEPTVEALSDHALLRVDASFAAASPGATR